MIRIGILGDIGSGKSYIAKNFGYPVFNADKEVGKLYKKDRKIFNKLQKALPKYLFTFPVDKKEITKAILANKANLKKIIKIVHVEIRKKMNIFLKKNSNEDILILDIPVVSVSNITSFIYKISFNIFFIFLFMDILVKLFLITKLDFSFL